MPIVDLQNPAFVGDLGVDIEITCNGKVISYNTFYYNEENKTKQEDMCKTIITNAKISSEKQQQSEPQSKNELKAVLKTEFRWVRKGFIERECDLHDTYAFENMMMQLRYCHGVAKLYLPASMR
jgi:hypothetical protein